MRYLRYFIILLISTIFILQFVSAQSFNSSSCRQFINLIPVSTSASSSLENYPASNAIDNNINTHWFGSPDEAYPKWIYFDLGENRCVNSANLTIFILDSPLSFKLQISKDSKTWVDLSDKVIIKSGEDFAFVNFNAQYGRYVRVLELSGKRPQGVLSEISFLSSSLLSPDGNKISLKILDSKTSESLKDVSFNIKEKSDIIQIDKTDNQGKIILSDLSSNEHQIEILCPVANYEQTIFSRLFSVISSYLSNIIKPTGNALFNQDSGYGNGVEAPKTPEQKKLAEVIADKSLRCGTYSSETPKKAVASSEEKDHPSSNAIDNNLNTYWFGNSAEAYPKWIYFDLEEEKCVNSLSLAINSFDIPSNIKLQISNDAESWKDISEERLIDNDGTNIITFNESTGRYVRVLELYGKRDYGSISEAKINSATIEKEISVVKSSAGIVEKKVNPSIIVTTKDSIGKDILSKVKATVFNPETTSFAKQTTNKQGRIIFANALSKDTQLVVYCPQ